MGFLAPILGAVAGSVISGIFQHNNNAQNAQNATNAQNNANALNKQGLQDIIAQIINQYQQNPNPAISMENIQGPTQWGGALGGGELGANGMPLALNAPQPTGQMDPGQLIAMLTGGIPPEAPPQPPQQRVNNLPGNRMSGAPVYADPPEGRLSPLLRYRPMGQA